MPTEIEIFDADRMQEIEDGTIVSGEVVGDHLILTKHDESTVDAGNVRGAGGYTGDKGDKGDKGDTGDPGSGNSGIMVSSQKSDNYAPVVGDIGKCIELIVDTDQNLVLGTDSDVGWPDGATFKICQMGLGKWTIVPFETTVVHGLGQLKTAGRYAEVFLRKRAVDEWVASGDLLPDVSDTPPPPPEGAFVYDTFTDAAETALTDHVGEIGAAWAVNPATPNTPPEISSDDKLHRGAHPNRVICYASAVPASADYEVTGDFSFVGASGNGYAGIYARLATDANTGYLLQHDYYSGAHTWTLYSVVAGAYTNLGTVSASPAGTATLRVVGDAITVLIDGAEAISVTNSDHSDAGRVGLTFDPSDDHTDGILIDNLSAV